MKEQVSRRQTCKYSIFVFWVKRNTSLYLIAVNVMKKLRSILDLMCARVDVLL